MKKAVLSLFALMLLLSSACYHATIETGMEPSNQTIEKPFASGWIYGLVPPSTIETAQRCPNGVAKVETKISFLNYVATFVTLGIYTPMDVKVTCASSSVSAVDGFTPDIFVDEGATNAEIQYAFDNAARQSKDFQKPIYVAFR